LIPLNLFQIVSEAIVWHLEVAKCPQGIMQHHTTLGPRRRKRGDGFAVALDDEPFVPVVDAVEDV
jgi:hypothetical protein